MVVSVEIVVEGVVVKEVVVAFVIFIEGTILVIVVVILVLFSELSVTKEDGVMESFSEKSDCLVLDNPHPENIREMTKRDKKTKNRFFNIVLLPYLKM